MCGIVGLFLKRRQLEPELGRLTAGMISEMRDRGPDSAGFAVYSHAVAGTTKICLVARDRQPAWETIAQRLAEVIGEHVGVDVLADHAVLTTTGEGNEARKWLIENAPEASVLSHGQSIEVFKGVGDPNAVAALHRLSSRSGSHAIGHTRMATESAVTVEGSHPFSTGNDTCLVHNGSLSNHNRLRDFLKRRGERFLTENDTEVAAGYLSWRMREGDDLDAALRRALNDLDGFYTFVVATRDGFAVLRDRVACKPAVMAETDDWVAFGTEFRALSQLPGIDEAKIWEPQPATVYAWERRS